MAKYYYSILCCLSFILIWNTYPATINKYIPVAARVAAIVTSDFTLGIIYRGGEDDNIQRFAPQWWGILGLIGWAYLASSLVTLFSKEQVLYNTCGMAFLLHLKYGL